MMGYFTRYPFQHKNICSLPNMNVKLLGTLGLAKRNTEVFGPDKQSVIPVFFQAKPRYRICSIAIFGTRSSGSDNDECLEPL